MHARDEDGGGYHWEAEDDHVCGSLMDGYNHLHASKQDVKKRNDHCHSLIKVYADLKRLTKRHKQLIAISVELLSTRYIIYRSVGRRVIRGRQ
ncbi:hypothetical protein KIN20_029695 [Parelaphostrongylus tenuis]|uniref:Uncharacterized protein n=1 Tax=Parelaphostrongylus tenuis TaxID=148309 RepID=A0AAD5WFT7_PARTN|nr:hypothetical protein KIN20_029695 [Parelaphostrongylus tenuis]